MTCAVLSSARNADFGSLRHRTRTAAVVVATVDIPEGMIVDPTVLSLAQWPVGSIPAAAFNSVDAVIGGVARTTVHKGEAIMPERLVAGTAGFVRGVSLTPGKRAYGVRVVDPSVIVDWSRPNGRADVMVAIDTGHGDQRAELVVADVRVLAIGMSPQQLADGHEMTVVIVVTLEVTPAEAERLAIATGQGQLRLVPSR